MPERKTILLAENEHGVRKLVENALEDQYNVIVAANGAEAYSRALDHEVHLLLTDIEMPRVNGIELAKRLKAERPNLPVVFMTGSHFDLPEEDAVVIRKPFQLIRKPFQLGVLLVTVRQALEQPGP